MSNSVAVNGNTAGWHPSVQDEINLALHKNGGFKRIETAFRQRLDESGWSQNLKEYCTHLFRSGKASTYDEALAEIMRLVKFPGASHEVPTSDSPDAPDLTVSRAAAEGGAEAVKKELKQVCVLKK